MSPHRSDSLNWKEMSVEDILKLAIADEEDAQEYYAHAAQLAGDYHTRCVLLRLSDMEKGHAEELRKELESLQAQRELETGMAD
jgi:rubrerythrin